jgi:hypothetical protein
VLFFYRCRVRLCVKYGKKNTEGFEPRYIHQRLKRNKMVILTILVLISSTALPAAHDEKEISYDELVVHAQDNCTNARASHVDTELLWRLVDVEKLYGPPPELRGMILAAACVESGFNPRAKGDKKFSKNGKKPMAVGILQMWGVYEKAYGVNRTDPVSSAHGWMKHIVRMLPKVKKQCRYSTQKRLWIAAWVTGIRSAKKGGRCKETPKHLRTLRRWHKNIKKQRYIHEAKKYECGCLCCSGE